MVLSGVALDNGLRIAWPKDHLKRAEADEHRESSNEGILTTTVSREKFARPLMDVSCDDQEVPAWCSESKSELQTERDV